MLRRTPQMLKKPGINKGNELNYLQWIFWHSSSESSMFAFKNRALKSHVTQLAGKKRSLHSLWSVEWIPNAPYPSPTDSPTIKNIFSYFELIPNYFCVFNFTLFLIITIIIQCSGMPGCSMFHVPCSLFLILPTAVKLRLKNNSTTLAYNKLRVTTHDLRF